MQVSARVVRNSSVRMANFALGLGISFFLMPFLVRNLGDRMYGLWTLVGSVLGYYGLIDLGLSSAVTRFMSRAMGRRDEPEIRAVFCTAFYLFLTLGIIAATATWTLTFFLGAIVKDPADLHLFTVLLLIMGLNFSFDFPIRAFSSVSTSTLRDDLSAGLTILKTIVSTVFVVWAINRGWGVLALAVISVSFSVVDSLIRVWLAYRLEPAISVRPRYFQKAKVKELFSYSAYTFVGTIADILCFRLAHLITTIAIGLNAVTHFFVAGRLVELMMDSLTQMIRSVGPVFSQDEGRNDFDAIRRRFRFMVKISLFFAVFGCGLAMIYGGHFIRRWMGPEYSDSYAVLLVLVGGYVSRLIQLPAIPLLYSISKHKYYTYTNLFEGSVNLILTLYLVERFGIVGVAMGTAIPMTLTSLFLLPWYLCKVIELDRKKYLGDIGRNLAVALAGLGAGVAPGLWIARDAYPALIACLAIHAVLYWPVAIMFGFTRDERVSLFGAIRRALTFLQRPAPGLPPKGVADVVR